MNTNILDQASNLVDGDRSAAYGGPTDDFTCAAAMFSAYLSRTNGKPVVVRPKDIGLFQIMNKITREGYKHKQDNLVDIAGYAACVDWCENDLGAPTGSDPKQHVYHEPLVYGEIHTELL